MMEYESNEGSDWLVSLIPYIPVIVVVVIFGVAMWSLYPSTIANVEKMQAEIEAKEVRGYDLILDLDNAKVVRSYNNNSQTYIAELEGQGFSITDTRHFEGWNIFQRDYTDIELHREAGN